jgi:ABC-type multidrug transport system ATPase subunit
MSVVVLRGAQFDLLTPINLELGPGLHTLLGSPGDGSEALVGLLAGSQRPRSGRVAVGGRDPGTTPEVRRSIASLLPEEQLPPGRSVLRTLGLLLQARGGPDPAEALASVELSHWASRPTATLSRAERRALVFSAALATRAPIALVLYEPLADIPGIPRTVALQRIQAFAAQGVCVVCATASPEDAMALGGSVWLLERGRLATRAPHAAALFPSKPLRWRVRLGQPRELGGLLLRRQEISTIEYDLARSPRELVVCGVDPAHTALIVLEVACHAGLRVEAIRAVMPSLEEIQAATAGAIRGAYEQAYQQAVRPAPDPGAASS